VAKQATNTLTSVAIVIAAIILAATFTSVPVLATASAATNGNILGMSGTVEIKNSGSDLWRPLASSDIVQAGDTVMTGANGLLLLKVSSTGKILLSEETNVTFSDSDLTASNLLSGQIEPVGLETVAHGHHHLRLFIGKIWAFLQSENGGQDSYDAAIGTNTAIGIRGTEFTATAYENGTANVMVVDGVIAVQDNTSNSTVTLQANQMVTVPNVPGGLSQQDLSQRVETVNLNSSDRWWDEPVTTFTASSTNLAVYVVVTAVVVAVFVAAVSVLYISSRKRKAKTVS